MERDCDGCGARMATPIGATQGLFRAVGVGGAVFRTYASKIRINWWAGSELDSCKETSSLSCIILFCLSPFAGMKTQSVSNTKKI